VIISILGFIALKTRPLQIKLGHEQKRTARLWGLWLVVRRRIILPGAAQKQTAPIAPRIGAVCTLPVFGCKDGDTFGF
jgi:hypothetical protein